MGLKEMIFNNNNNKIENSLNHNNTLSIINMCEQQQNKQITDFSIKRILSDSNNIYYDHSDNTKNKDNIENKQENDQRLNEILDLSKNKQENYFDNNCNNVQKYLPFQNYYYLNEEYLTLKRITTQAATSLSSPASSASSASSLASSASRVIRNHPLYNSSSSVMVKNYNQIIAKPRCYKSWEEASYNNCIDCKMYYFNSFNTKRNHMISNVKGATISTTTNIKNYHNICNDVEMLTKSYINSSSIKINFSSKFTNTNNNNNNNNNKVSNICDLVIDNKTELDDEISHKCEYCDKVFGCVTTLQSHERTHKSPRYECLDCGKGFSQLRNYKYHLSVHRGTKEFAAKCPECGKTFNDKGYLSSHMKIHRNKKEYECLYCPKSFNQRVAFNMHVRIHTGVKPHKCNECGKRFSRKMLLKQHMRTHSGEKPYQCTVCGKSFADRSNMTLHHRLHSGIKPFSCPVCPKAFTKKHHLKTHLNYHTGCKPYICPHPNCNQAFTQSSNMRTHSKKCQYRPLEFEEK